MASGWGTFVAWVGIVSGAASLYGAFESWRQRQAANEQNRQATQQNREAARTRAAVVRAEERVRRLVQRQATQQLVSDAVGNLRLAEAQLVLNVAGQMTVVRGLLNSADRALARLAVDPQVDFWEAETGWAAMRDQTARLSAALLTTAFPAPMDAIRGSSRILLRIAGDLEGLSVVLATRAGVEDAGPD